eukprot:6197674-Pleurochrysis_carterae.AAC.2
MHASQVARPRRLFGSHRDSETASAVVVRAAALFELRRDVSFSERVALAPRTVAPTVRPGDALRTRRN